MVPLFCLVALVQSICLPPSPPGQRLVSPYDVPTNVTQYIQAVQAGSGGECSVAVAPDNTYIGESITRLHYFYISATGNASVDSWGYQYSSFSRQIVHWTQLYEASNTPNAEIFESGTFANGSLYDVYFDAGTPTCLSIPGVPFPQPYASVTGTQAGAVSTYMGVLNFTVGYLQKGWSYDLYAVDGIWFPGATVIFFIDRADGQLVAQLYHQTANGGPNYFYDIGGWQNTGASAQALFSANTAIYFTDPTFRQYCSSPSVSPTRSPGSAAAAANSTPAPSNCSDYACQIGVGVGVGVGIPVAIVLTAIISYLICGRRGAKTAAPAPTAAGAQAQPSGTAESGSSNSPSDNSPSYEGSSFDSYSS